MFTYDIMVFAKGTNRRFLLSLASPVSFLTRVVHVWVNGADYDLRSFILISQTALAKSSDVS